MSEESMLGTRTVPAGTCVEVTLWSGRRVLSRQQMSAGEVESWAVVQALMFNRLAVVGGVEWWDPVSGRSIERPTFTVKLVGDAAPCSPSASQDGEHVSAASGDDIELWRWM